MIEDSHIAVWFSCGAASAVAAKMTIEKYGHANTIRILNNPVIEEQEDNRRFAKDVEAWLGIEIEEVVNPKWPENSAVAVWDKRKFMSGPLGAPCTIELKKMARQHWENTNRADWHVLGFTADEVVRHNRFTLTERDNVIPVLIDANIRKSDCFKILDDAGIKLPNAYYQGYPNANCKGCVKATSATYWNLVRSADPEVFEQRAEQSRRIGAKLVRHNGKRLYLDELPADAKGRALKSLVMPECGIFCEEK